MFDFGPAAALHANGMKLFAFDADGELLRVDSDLSIGDCFIITEAELKALTEVLASDLGDKQKSRGYPNPFVSAAEMLELGAQSGLIIAALKRTNEASVMGQQVLNDRLASIWQAMDNCHSRALTQEGILPGGLKV